MVNNKITNFSYLSHFRLPFVVAVIIVAFATIAFSISALINTIWIIKVPLSAIAVSIVALISNN
jgi:hypothetical protein